MTDHQNKRIQKLPGNDSSLTRTENFMVVAQKQFTKRENDGKSKTKSKY